MQLESECVQPADTLPDAHSALPATTMTQMTHHATMHQVKLPGNRRSVFVLPLQLWSGGPRLPFSKFPQCLACCFGCSPGFHPRSRSASTSHHLPGPCPGSSHHSRFTNFHPRRSTPALYTRISIGTSRMLLSHSMLCACGYPCCLQADAGYHLPDVQILRCHRNEDDQGGR